MAERKFSAVISIGAELGASFRSTFGGLDSRIRSVGSSLRGLNDAQKNISGYARSLGAVKTARQEVADQGAKLIDLQKQTHWVEDAEGMATLTREIETQRAAYDKARATLVKRNEILDKERATLKAAGIDTAKLSDETERLGREVALTSAKLASLGRIKGITADIGRSMQKLRSDALQAGIAVGAVGLAFWKTVKGFADFSDNANETSAALGMTAEQLLGISYAGQRVGVDAEQMATALNKFNQTLADAQENGGKSAEVFDKLGVDIETLAMLPADKRIEMMADAFRSIQDPLERTQLATDAFGAKAYKMANVLSLGSKELRRLRKEATDTGYIPSKELAARADQFDESFGKFKATLIGIRNEIGGALLPIVNRFLNFFTEHTLPLKAAIGAFAVVLTGTAVVAVAKLGLTAVTTIRQVGLLIAEMRVLGGLELAGTILNFGSIGKALKGIIPMISGLTGEWLPALIGSLEGVGTALAAAVGATPLGWIIAIVAAVVGLAVLIYKYWAPIKTFFGGLWEGLSDGFRDAVAGFMDALGPLAGPLKAAIETSFRPFVIVLGAIKDAITWLFKPFQQTNEAMQETANTGRMVGRVLSDVMLAPLRLITAQINAVRTGLSYIGIGKAPGQEVSGAAGATGADSLTSPGLPSVPIASAASNNRAAVTNTNTITVNAAPGQDARQVSDEVMRRLDERKQQQDRTALFDVQPAY